MADQAKRQAWLERVLGMQFAAGTAAADGPDPAAGAPGPATVWRDAKERVDGKLSALSGALRSFGDPDLDRIADYGLFGLTDGQGVGLARAMLEFDGAPPDRRAAAAGALRKAVQAYRARMDSDPVVALVDDNPFGVDVGLRATLGDALSRVEQSLG